MSSYKDKNNIRNFWKSRVENSENTVCTNDAQLDLLEEDQIIKRIKNDKSILEVGCGNGKLLDRLQKKIAIKSYYGTDFVQELIDKANKKYFKYKNVNFDCFDMSTVSDKSFDKKFDYIISKRAIQNILSAKIQLKIIDNLGLHLRKSGKVILVESSSNAQKNINEMRKKYGLKKINPPFHNLFLNEKKLKSYKFKNVKLTEVDNFASNFYFITRVIYALYTQNYLKSPPSYSDYHNQIGLEINDDLLKTDFSQVKTFIFTRK